jgi:hypothetical protein
MMGWILNFGYVSGAYKSTYVMRQLPIGVYPESIRVRRIGRASIGAKYQSFARVGISPNSEFKNARFGEFQNTLVVVESSAESR